MRGCGQTGFTVCRMGKKEQGMKKTCIFVLALLLTVALWGCREEVVPPSTVVFGGQPYLCDVTELDLSGAPLEDLSQLALLPNLQKLDLSNTGLTSQQYEELKALYPQCQILWTPVFQGVEYPEDTASLKAESLTQEDMDQLAYFPGLTEIDLTACRDYETVQLLMAAYPDLEVHYLVDVAGQMLKPDATEAAFADITDGELTTAVQLLPQLRSVRFMGELPSPELLALMLAEHPQIDFYWSVEIHGKCFDWDATEIDLCGIPMEDVSEVEEKARYLPLLQKVLMWDCGISNEDMEALNQRNDKVLFVWKVWLGNHVRVRTDIDNFICHNYNYFLSYEECDNLRYCTEIVALDLGHRDIWHCEFVAYMPKLKYLILGDTLVSDLTPLTGLENLVFLEIFLLDIDSYEPLLTLKNLEDLNIGFTHGDPEVIKQMTWLKRLWWTGNKLSWAQQQELREALPDTEMCFNLGYSSTGGGWRKNQNYYDMRELLGMPDES